VKPVPVDPEPGLTVPFVRHRVANPLGHAAALAGAALSPTKPMAATTAAAIEIPILRFSSLALASVGFVAPD
jgi:hypothetical protein